MVQEWVASTDAESLSAARGVLRQYTQALQSEAEQRQQLAALLRSLLTPQVTFQSCHSAADASLGSASMLNVLGCISAAVSMQLALCDQHAHAASALCLNHEQK